MQQELISEVKLHEINVKGYYHKSGYDAILQKKFGDISYGYGKLLFTGTDKQLDELLDYLVKHEGELRFKII